VKFWKEFCSLKAKVQSFVEGGILNSMPDISYLLPMKVLQVDLGAELQ
jgi:hypothetical protein